MSSERLSRVFLAAAGVAFVATGAIFFVAPGYSAENFPWNVSPFVAMTIGGWAIGTGLIALDAARRWRLGLIFPSLAFVWTFSLFQLIVVVGFLGALRTDHWLTWPYLLSMLLGLLSFVTGIPVIPRLRAEMRAEGLPMPTWVRLLIVIFTVVVGLLAVVTLFTVASGGSVFPEPLSPFTTRAFSAFFLSLVIGAGSLLFARDLRSAIYFATVGNLLVVPITLAALLNLDKFNFAQRPGGAVYIGAYVITSILAVGSGIWYGRRYGWSFDRPERT